MSNKYNYWKLICRQSTAIWYYEDDLDVKERKFFYELMLESMRELDNIRNGEYGE